MAVTGDELFVAAASVAAQNLYCGKSGDGGAAFIN
jgi:hypothetical protein